MESDPWLIYALGGGWGHLNRAIALARVVATQSSVKILTNSPYADWISQTLQQWALQGQAVPELVVFPANIDRPTLCGRVQSYLLNNVYRCLIVDTFPRGLGGELADLLPTLPVHPKVLIHRDINPNYIRSRAVPEFVAAHYDQVIIPGEGSDVPLAALPQVSHTDPWLIYSAPELGEQLRMSQLHRETVRHQDFWKNNPTAPLYPSTTGFRQGSLIAARMNAANRAGLPTPPFCKNLQPLRLRVWQTESPADSAPQPQKTPLEPKHSQSEQPAAPLIVVCASGNASEQALFGSLTSQLSHAFPQAKVRCLAHDCPPECPPDHWVRVWPGLPWIAQATVVVGSGGYNTVYECAALKKPLIAFALSRLYDLQARRLSRYGKQVQTLAGAVIAVGEVLSAAEPASSSSPTPNQPTAQSHHYPTLSLEIQYDNGATAAFEQIQALL